MPCHYSFGKIFKVEILLFRMNKPVIIFCCCLILAVSVVGFYNNYRIPTLITNDYDCEKHPGFFSDSNPMPFESSQNYINRKSKSVKRQIEGVCDGS